MKGRKRKEEQERKVDHTSSDFISDSGSDSILDYSSVP